MSQLKNHKIKGAKGIHYISESDEYFVVKFYWNKNNISKEGIANLLDELMLKTENFKNEKEDKQS